MERKQKFNDEWMFHLGELKQQPVTGRTKSCSWGGAANASNEEGRFYPLPQSYWAIIGGSGEKAGNACLNLPEKLEDTWEPARLPHDWKIRQNYVNPQKTDGGLHNLGGDCLPTGKGYYRKVFDLPKESDGQRIHLQFEGVMQKCVVWFNGSMVGKHFSGYSAFELDVTEYALYGEEGKNVLLVETDCRTPEGWWGEGAGIYRDVWLKILPPVHLEKDGCFVRTKRLTEEDAELLCLLDIKNDSGDACTVQAVVSIFSPDGEKIDQKEIDTEIGACQSGCATLNFQVKNPQLWDLDNPDLYQAKVEIRAGNQVDHYHQDFGIRSMVYSREKGLLLNGKAIELKGACVHQDFAGVGIGLTKDIICYRLKKLKEMGGNAYRSAHHTASRRLLELCDKMGILVLNELRHFETERENLSDFEDLLKASRNHPCVFMYCLGNEEFVELVPQGKRIGRRLMEIGRSLDPDRAFCEAAQFGRDKEDFQEIWDVAGYNYDFGEAKLLLEKYPKAKVMATEDASYLSTRGIYEDMPEKGWCDCYEGETYYAKLARKNGIDLGTMGGAVMGLKLTKVYENNRKDTPQLGGMFIWTAFDYRGETFPWNWPAVVSSYGAMDFCGFEKDVFYYWKSIWTDEAMVHMLPHWTWPEKEGKNIRLEISSNCDEVEIFINGMSQGKQKHEKGSLSVWNVLYEPGELKAIGYREQQEVAEEIFHTAKEAAKVELEYVYNGERQALFKAKIVDADGIFCPGSCVPVVFQAEGGSICGVGNGDPACHEPDVSDHITTFNGLALCIVDKESDEGWLRASVPGLVSGECRIKKI